MSQQIRRFGIGQTAKVVAVLYALMGLVFLPFFLAAAAFGGIEVELESERAAT